MKFLMGFLSMFMVRPGPVYADTSNFVIVDVRTDEEFNQSHVSGAIQIDILKRDFKDQVAKMDKNKTYKLYCRSGNRSGQALSVMKSMGFKDLENLGSLNQAAKKLNLPCEGKESC